MPPIKVILAKGSACASCKARKVRCDAIKPSCTACRRSARFRGENPDDVRCCYDVGVQRRCSTGGKGAGAKKSRVVRKSSMDVEETPEQQSPAAVVEVDTVESSSYTLPPLPTPPPILPVASTSTSTPSPLPSLPQRFNLPAPIALSVPSLPAFLLPPAPQEATAAPPPLFDAFSAPLPLEDKHLSALLDSIASTLPYAPYTLDSRPQQYQPHYTASPDSFALSSPASDFSFSSFSDNSTAPSSSLGSPFSLCEDLDLAYSTFDAAPSSPPPLFLPTNTSSSFMDAPVFSFPAGTSQCACIGDAFLPTAHDCDKTLAPSLFDSYPWSSAPSR